MELVLGSEIKPVVSIESTLEKLDIRTGRVLEVELSEDAPKKSYKLLIDFGRFGTRRSVARLTTHTKEELLDSLVFAVLNFEPKMVGSTKSEVLVLGVQLKKADSGDATFITPSSGNVKLGSKLS